MFGTLSERLFLQPESGFAETNLDSVANFKKDFAYRSRQSDGKFPLACCLITWPEHGTDALAQVVEHSFQHRRKIDGQHAVVNADGHTGPRHFIGIDQTQLGPIYKLQESAFQREIGFDTSVEEP